MLNAPGHAGVLVIDAILSFADGTDPSSLPGAQIRKTRRRGAYLEQASIHPAGQRRPRDAC
jgi:hypothetical protein